MIANKISVRRLQPGEWELFKQIRLVALQDSPFAFTTTYESALKRSPESWREQADASAQGSDRATFIAFSGDTPIGIMALYRDQEKNDTGELIQVWVSPEHRGKGAADSLMETVFSWAGENGFRWVLAGINPGNDRALKFYLKYGFRPVQESSGKISENMLIKEIEIAR